MSGHDYRTFPEILGGPHDGEPVPDLPGAVMDSGYFKLASMSPIIYHDPQELPVPVSPGYAEDLYTRRLVAFGDSTTGLHVWVNSKITDSAMGHEFWNRLLDRAGCRAR